jgi:prepilin-type N-terminal cleavage/methylation domain-containing protein
MPRANFRRSRSGFTLIETLVALSVLMIFFAAISMLLQQIMQDIGQSRVRATALGIAQARMETVRNLPYASVGTSGGIPSGPLPQTETVTINNMPFTVTTSIVYVDDTYDGVAPTDLINTDYKRVRVELTWGGAYPSRQPVTLVTNIVPKGVETVVGGGTLMITVYDSAGLPVPNATVTFDNTAVTPQIHFSTLTNTNGVVVLPGAPKCVACYKITATKNLYSTDRTYDTTEVPNPLQPYATVIEGQVTQRSFSIDQISTITVQSLGTRESGYAPVANVIFRLTGAKVIGYDTHDDPVYKYSQQFTTGGGSVGIPALEWDTYTLDFSASFHVLAGSVPTNPIALLPGTNLTIPIAVAPKSNQTLLLTAKRPDGQLLASASATIKGFGPELTAYTGATGAADMGQAFFGNLTAGTYSLKLSLPGYTEATSTVTLAGNQQETLTLNPIP